MKTYECAICGWIYDETKGCPEEGIPAGTRWEDVPEDWHCPVCGAGKGDFQMVAMEPEPAGNSVFLVYHCCWPPQWGRDEEV